MTTDATDPDGVDSLVERVVADFNRHDAHDFAAHFTPTASFVDVLGQRMVGRDGIEAGHRFPFEGPLAEADLVIEGRDDVAVHPDVVVVDLSWRSRGGRGRDGRVVGDRVGLLTLTAVHREGRWQFALGHNVDYSTAFDRDRDAPDGHTVPAGPQQPGRALPAGECSG